MDAPRLVLRSVEIFERLMPFMHPFRFGPSVVEAAPQAFVRVEAEVPGFGVATGCSAEMMMPKWFDKDPSKSPADTVDDLRRGLVNAASAYLAAGADTAFGLSAAVRPGQDAWAEREKVPALAAGFGPALLDKAVLDALLRAIGVGVLDGLRRNAMGLDARLTPDLEPGRLAAFLAGLVASPAVAVRHTIGLLDPLDGPHGLPNLIAAAQLAFFKIKIGGDIDADITRLEEIAVTLDAVAPGFVATLDANEQYDPDRLEMLADALGRPSLAVLRARLLYVEQPFDRRATFAAPLSPALHGLTVIIDEADDAYDSFVRASALGYRGVSSKACKGLYKSILNAARVKAWNAAGVRAPFLLSGEDLTCQAGLAVEQDTALIAALGLTHGERNGHHYVAGFGPAPEAEARAFAAAHPDLYTEQDGRIVLDVRRGLLPTRALLAAPGFARRAEPDWESLAPITPRSAAPLPQAARA
ncbi:enolase [Xanthobacter dioxanivorans]|uniref:Enolase n=1 Tax=Xanthobacter dioxanivorans TaxID=2528964 RepID=A0A974PSX4_9HYPH|nr:enolase [Xanthobacter dioxanivorans]QRG08495.1 enolase [Xanthobacter dioxanivorans]